MVKRDNLIILVDSNRLLFYLKKAVKTLELKLNTQVMADVEVVNREKLEELIDNVFSIPNFKGKEFNTTIIFSQKTSFEKEIKDDNSKAEFEETQKFLDMVPFEEVLSNSYRINKKTKVVAVNKILYNILKQVLEKNKAHALLVLPMTVLASTNSELSTKIDFSFIETKLESFHQYSLVDLEELGLGGEVTNAIGIKKKNVRVSLLLLVMLGLFLVLLYLIYVTIIAAPKRVKHTTIIPKTTTVEENKINESEIASESSQISTPSALLEEQP